VEPVTPGPIGSNAPVETDPSIVEQIAPSAPSVGGQK
jgi:hypothetical protein